jgi:hypothetical protein
LRVDNVAEMNCLTAFCSSRRTRTCRFHLFNFGEHRVARGGKFIRVHNGAHAEQARHCRDVSPRVHVMHDALPLAHLLEKPRTASAAEQHGQHVQRRHVGMAEFRDVPGEMKMAEFDGRFLDDFARRGLLRFLGQYDRRHRRAPWFFVGGADLRDDFVVFTSPTTT